MLDKDNQYFDLGTFTGEGVPDANRFNYNQDTIIPELVSGKQYYAIYSFDYNGVKKRHALTSRTYNMRELGVLKGTQCAVYHDGPDFTTCVCKKLPAEYINKTDAIDNSKPIAPPPEQVAPVREEVVKEPEPKKPVDEIQKPTAPAPMKKKKKKKKVHVQEEVPVVEPTHTTGFLAEVVNGVFPLFKGRACRREYWVAAFTLILPYAILSLLCLIPKVGFIMFAVVGSVYMLMCLVLSFSLMTNRLADQNKPRVFALLSLVPIGNLIVAILCGFVKGTPEQVNGLPDHRTFYKGSGAFKAVVLSIVTGLLLTLGLVLGAKTTIESLFKKEAPVTTDETFDFGDGTVTEEPFDFGDGTATEEPFDFGDGTATEEPFDFGDGTATEEQFDFEDTSTQPAEDTFPEAWQDPNSDETSVDWDWDTAPAETDETVSNDDIEGFEEFNNVDFLNEEGSTEAEETTESASEENASIE